MNSVPALTSGEAFEAVLRALASGSVVGVPTDTVYGLAVRCGDEEALRRLFVLKGRPASVAIAVLVADLAQAGELAGDSVALARLAERFWPGPLTVVVRKRAGLGLWLGGFDDTVGLRCPAEDYVRALCRAAGPLAVSSANRHGEAPLTSAGDLAALFGDDLLVVDGGRRDGVPSTVVSLEESPARQLREGPVAFADIAAALGASPPP